MYGCEPGTVSKTPIITKLGDKFDRCPKAWVREDAQREFVLLGDVSLHKSSKLPPREGGFLNQDAQFIDALGAYDAGLEDYQQWAEKLQG